LYVGETRDQKKEANISTPTFTGFFVVAFRAIVGQLEVIWSVRGGTSQKNVVGV
jgi:hypothetical protein